MRRKFPKMHQQFNDKYSRNDSFDQNNQRSTQAFESNSGFNPTLARFPFCIVWTPLPLLTWLLPFIGHTGIGMSNGIIHDFSGPYTITVNDFAFGQTHKYVPLGNINKTAYDSAVRKSDETFKERMHNLCINNCHHHVADILNLLKFEGKSNWTQFSVWWMCIARSKYVRQVGFKGFVQFVVNSFCHVIKTYIGFAIISIFVLVMLLV